MRQRPALVLSASIRMTSFLGLQEKKFSSLLGEEQREGGSKPGGQHLGAKWQEETQPCYSNVLDPTSSSTGSEPHMEALQTKGPFLLSRKGRILVVRSGEESHGLIFGADCMEPVPGKEC